MSKNQKPAVALPVRLLLGISFVEGAAVMVVELLGAKIIAPYYGVSLYVWSSVLGVTLGALALGYFSGGGDFPKISRREQLVHRLAHRGILYGDRSTDRSTDTDHDRTTGCSDGFSHIRIAVSTDPRGLFWMCISAHYSANQ